MYEIKDTLKKVLKYGHLTLSTPWASKFHFSLGEEIKTSHEKLQLFCFLSIRFRETKDQIFKNHYHVDYHDDLEIVFWLYLHCEMQRTFSIQWKRMIFMSNYMRFRRGYLKKQRLIDFCKFHRLVTVSTLFEPRACQKVNWVWIGQQRTSNRSTISYEGVTV